MEISKIGSKYTVKKNVMVISEFETAEFHFIMEKNHVCIEVIDHKRANIKTCTKKFNALTPSKFDYTNYFHYSKIVNVVRSLLLVINGNTKEEIFADNSCQVMVTAHVQRANDTTIILLCNKYTNNQA